MDRPTRTPDGEALLDELEERASHAGADLLTSRLDSGMDPTEARESVRRWSHRLAARVRRGVEEGTRRVI